MNDSPEITILDGPLTEADVDALVVPVFTDGRLDGAAHEVDTLLGGFIARAFASHEIAGKTGETVLMHVEGRSFRIILVVGLGERARHTAANLARYAGSAARYLGKRGVQRLAFALPAATTDPGIATAAVVEGTLAGSLDTALYRSSRENPIDLRRVSVLSQNDGKTFDIVQLESGKRRGLIVGKAVNIARVMALTPANDMTPTHMAQRAATLAAEAGLRCDVLEEEAMREFGMGALLSVSRGSAESARLVVLYHDGAPESRSKLALVGKGVTFDSGGLSIKSAKGMEQMKYDMSAGAAVIASMWALGQLKPKANIIGVVPMTENLPGPSATRPGDIVRAMNGTTIEVLNTDAEGRLILADALCYAKDLGATEIVDCATLTGACINALEHAAGGLMSNDDTMVATFMSAASTTTERYWRLPLFDEYANDMESEIADLRNVGGKPTAATCKGGAFLQRFVGETSWIHLDVAGTAYVDSPGTHMAAGPTGTPVRSLIAFAEARAAQSSV